MEQVRCRRCGNAVVEGAPPCVYCDAPHGTDDASAYAAPGRLNGCVWGAVILVVLVGGWMFAEFRASESYLVKSRLSKALSAIDPVKTGIAMAYEKTRKMPVAYTVVTSANQGGTVTPDWAALGFSALPRLPREVSVLRVAPGGVIVVTLANIDGGIDDTEVRAKPVRNQAAWSWVYDCTSDDGRLKKYFRC